MPTLIWLEIQGFRSFSVNQRLEFREPLALIWGGNSQGKTALAEAIEFLFTGDTVRRTLLGGDRGEFNDSLRCAHHPTDEPVILAAGITDASGAEHHVVRTLDLDIGRGQDCASTLTIDGTIVPDLSTLGIVLAEPPLRAPVLFQHNVRYALSARPIDRLAYFKTLLEMQDLDELSEAMSIATEAIAIAETPLTRDLAACTADERLSSALAPLLSGAPSAAIVETALGAAVDVALLDVGATSEVGTGLTAHADVLMRELARHTQRRFDFAAWQPGAPPGEQPDEALARTGEYSALAVVADAEVERLRVLFDALLAVPAFADLTEPTDCPVCGTEDALTPDRIAVLRRHIDDASGLSHARTSAREELGAVLARLRGTHAATSAVAPRAARFDDEQVAQAETAVSAITGHDADLSAARVSAATLHAAQTAAVAALDAAAIAADELLRVVDELGPVDPEELSNALASATAAVSTLVAARVEFIAAAAVVLTPAMERLAEQVGTSAFGALVRLAQDPASLVSALRKRHAVSLVRAEYDAARYDIDQAKLAVFNAKFEGMSGEIARWWDLLRPDEPVQFHRAALRGQGRRAVALEAILQAEGRRDIVRDALGVLSDSQLNALGLAAFLARAALQKTPLIVLDDPVQAGDEAHRDTFVDSVIPALLDAGFQVLVTTFDYKLNRVLTASRTLDGFTVSLDEPASGTVVVKGTDTAAALLNDTKSFLHEGQAMRATGASRLRVAAEAVAKEILVAKRRALGERASIADYGSGRWTLERLVPILKEHLTDEGERGRWENVSVRLSPGAHDDHPPERNTLKVVYDHLKKSLAEHAA